MGLYGVEWSRKAHRSLGKMNGGQYCQILEDRMEESFDKLEMEEDECYFQQDNDPKHTSKQAAHVKQKRWPDWGLNPGPSRHIPDALTTELSGLTN